MIFQSKFLRNGHPPDELSAFYSFNSQPSALEQQNIIALLKRFIFTLFNFECNYIHLKSAINLYAFAMYGAFIFHRLSQQIMEKQAREIARCVLLHPFIRALSNFC